MTTKSYEVHPDTHAMVDAFSKAASQFAKDREFNDSIGDFYISIKEVQGGIYTEVYDFVPQMIFTATVISGTFSGDSPESEFIRDQLVALC